MPDLPGVPRQWGQIILQYRWLLASLFGLSAIAYEVIEHGFGRPPDYGLEVEFAAEILIFGLLVPLLFGSSLTLLIEAESQRQSAVHHLNLEYQLNENLSKVQSWDDLVTFLVSFLPVFLPLAGFTLFLADKRQSNFEKAAEWQCPEGTAKIISADTLSFVPQAEIWESRALHLATPDVYPNVSVPAQILAYSLPLRHGTVLTAVLLLYLPEQPSLLPEQLEILHNLAPAIAFAIDGVHPHGSGTIRAAATEAEQRRLARYLHDTLGQNLGYLVLKLEQLEGEDILQEIETVRQELARMHNVANEAYEQVRTTLTMLRPIILPDLVSFLRQQAFAVSQRTGMKVEFVSTGPAHTLAPDVQNKVWGIYREALANAEKHAAACHLDIRLNWSEQDLELIIADDGCGFDQQVRLPDEHYGLKIMEERAEEIHGRLTLYSRPGQGTTITLWLPLAATDPIAPVSTAGPR